MTAKVEFFYDLSSPWTRLAFHNIQAIIAETGAGIIWRPFLVGGVFNAVNDSVYKGRNNPDDPKVRNVYHWLKQWAKLADLPMNFPSPHHPIKSISAMRLCCALEQDQDALFRFSERAFDAYYREQANIDDQTVLSGIADQCGLDGKALVEQSQQQPTKDLLRKNTSEAIERGAFGSPTIFVNKKYLYFGNDQLPLVRQVIMTSNQ